jgi:hypothetical protein
MRCTKGRSSSRVAPSPPPWIATREDASSFVSKEIIIKILVIICLHLYGMSSHRDNEHEKRYHPDNYGRLLAEVCGGFYANYFTLNPPLERTWIHLAFQI